jgi:predicted deacylase
MTLAHTSSSLRRIRELDLADYEPGTTTHAWLHVINNGLGEPVRIPLIIARGDTDGPVFGLTAALHGNELNGIPVIQDLMRGINPRELKGTVVGVLVANVPSFLAETRKFSDGVDLNHIAPGRANGDCSQLYMHRLVDRIVSRFDYLIDLHTASFGRVNSYYIRADMSSNNVARMARLLHPDIILDNPPTSHTLRGHAARTGAHAITLELRDPHRFQAGVVKDSLNGIRNILSDIGMFPGTPRPFDDDAVTTVCDSSYWLYTNEGGLLTVLPAVGERVAAGQEIAVVKTVFGETVKSLSSPESGIVIGKSVNPVNQSGSRILHLGRNPAERSFPCIVDCQ